MTGAVSTGCATTGRELRRWFAQPGTIGYMRRRRRLPFAAVTRCDCRAESRPRGFRGLLTPAVAVFLPLLLSPAFGDERSAARQGAPAPLHGLQFPALEGHDIDGRKLIVPADLEGRYNLVLVAYERRHQRLVDSWVGSVRQLERRHDHLGVYEIPLIRNLSWVRRKRLDFRMSQGISDPVARATTITIYTDVDAVNRSLNIPHGEDIRLFLIDKAGAVYWRGAGPYDQGQFRALEHTVEALQSAAKT